MNILEKYFAQIEQVENEVGDQMRAKWAIIKVIKDFDFNNVLDIGCGPKKHTRMFELNGKTVDTLDGCEKYNPKFLGNFLDLADKIPDESYDCIWFSHVLEHEVNVGSFLTNVKKKLKDGGILAVTVPPLKAQIVGGHVNLYNLGLLIRVLVASGFDCSEGIGLSYDYDLSFIVRKKDIEWSDKIIKELDLNNSFVDKNGSLISNGGDLYKIKKYFPSLPWEDAGNDESYNGQLTLVSLDPKNPLGAVWNI
tara:strand:- start:57 stop:809 length:753 start_codon:yes stop_codon:yes gene_type:complete